MMMMMMANNQLGVLYCAAVHFHEMIMHRKHKCHPPPVLTIVCQRNDFLTF